MKRVFFVLLFILTACSWRSPNSTFYMMSSQGLSPLSEQKVSVAVAQVKVPDLLDRAQMVVYEKNGEVKILEFNRWGEILPDVLQATVVNDLIAYLPNAFVKRTYFDNQNVTYNVNIEVNNIQAYQGDKVILSAWWNISNAKGNTLIRRQGQYEAKVKGKSIEDLVSAQSQAVHHLSKDIAEYLLKK